MRSPELNMALSKWLSGKPKCVQDLAEEFPLGSVFIAHGEYRYLLGYTESDDLIVSKIDPNHSYRRATMHQEFLCAKHVRSGEVAYLGVIE